MLPVFSIFMYLTPSAANYAVWKAKREHLANSDHIKHTMIQ
jgi:hypothetical protein